MCAWGFTEAGARALVSVRLGAREAKEDWLELGRDLTSPGRAEADRGRRRARTAVGDRGALAARGSPPLPRASPAQPPREAARGRARPDPFNYGSALTRALAMGLGRWAISRAVRCGPRGGPENA